MLSEGGWNLIQVCYAIKKKKKKRPTPVTHNSSISFLAKRDFTLTVHPELCSCLTRSWAGTSSWQFLWHHVLSSVIPFPFSSVLFFSSQALISLLPTCLVALIILMLAYSLYTYYSTWVFYLVYLGVSWWRLYFSIDIHFYLRVSNRASGCYYWYIKMT